MSLLQYWRANYCRFTPNSWLDWFWCIYGNLKSRLDIWWFWFSPPWSATRRCPLCAGDGKESTESMDRYGVEPFECSFCKGSGKIKK